MQEPFGDRGPKLALVTTSPRTEILVCLLSRWKGAGGGGRVTREEKRERADAGLESHMPSRCYLAACLGGAECLGRSSSAYAQGASRLL